MPENKNPPRTRRLLLRAVGVGSSLALFGCSSSTAGTTVTEAGVHETSVHGLSPFDGGAGTTNHDAGHLPHFDGMVQGVAVHDAGIKTGDGAVHGAVVVEGGAQGLTVDGGGVGDSVDAAGPKG